MDDALKSLLSVAGDPLGCSRDIGDDQLLDSVGEIGVELSGLLHQTNGFFAFESALQVFPLGTSPSPLELRTWNDPLTWRAEYGDLISSKTLFFAQDVFGNQFGIRDGEIVLFYSEFGAVEPIAKSLAEWSEVVLSDWRKFTGYELAHKFQVECRPLVDGERLVPKIPFVLGGQYELANLYAGDIAEAMRFRASIARQIRNLPDGARVVLRVRPDA